ncbi:MAG: hypothetical protein ACI87E_004087, partial [Mariniblastus sp.]
HLIIQWCRCRLSYDSRLRSFQDRWSRTKILRQESSVRISHFSVAEVARLRENHLRIPNGCQSGYNSLLGSIQKQQARSSFLVFEKCESRT